MKQSFGATVAGAARYEFRMQIRRKAVWITMFLVGLLVFTGMLNPWSFPPDFPARDVVINWAYVVQTLMPIALGCLLADRLPRDHRTRVSELFETLPRPPGRWFFGKYLGATLATLVPIVLMYAAGVVYTVADRGEPDVILLALAMFATVNLPGLLFVAAFSVSCPAVLWVPLYQFLFVGYWFWGNLLSPDAGIPTLNGTMLTPIGQYAGAGFFKLYSPWSGQVTPWEGVASIALLLALSVLALYSAHRYLRWRQARR